MTQLIPEQWLRAEIEGVDKLFGITTRCCDAFERLTALNLQAIRFGLAESKEAMVRKCAADNLRALEIITVTDGELAEELLQTFGNADFAASWLVLSQPHFNGKNPLEVLSGGQRDEVVNVLRRIQYGISA